MDIMGFAAGHYEGWKPLEVRGRAVWARYKDGAATESAIVLTCGAITTGPILNPLLERLAAYPGRVLAIEPPGQGRSERIGRRRAIRDYAMEIADIALPVIGKDGLRSAILCGHCIGADAMHALAREEEVAGTVLLNPIPDNTYIGFLKAFMRFQRKSAESLVRKALGKAGPDNEYHLKDGLGPTRYNSGLIGIVRSAFDALRVWRSRGFGTQAGGSPAILVTGAYDVQVRPAELARLSEGMANSRVEAVPDAGHMTVLVSPLAVAEMITRLATERGRGA